MTPRHFPKQCLPQLGWLPFLLLAMATFTPVWADVTYSFGSGKYFFTNPYSNCTVGTCLNFTTDMSVSGSVVLNLPTAPLNANQMQVSGNLVSYSISNGLKTFTQVNSSIVQVFEQQELGLRISTDGQGRLIDIQFIITSWQNPASTSLSSRVDLVYVDTGQAIGVQNIPCTNVSGGICVSAQASDGAQSFGYAPFSIVNVTSISPSSGPAAGGTAVTIKGSGFNCPTPPADAPPGSVPGLESVRSKGNGSRMIGCDCQLQVTIGGVPATNVVVVDNETITATTDRKSVV